MLLAANDFVSFINRSPSPFHGEFLLSFRTISKTISSLFSSMFNTKDDYCLLFYGSSEQLYLVVATESTS